MNSYIPKGTTVIGMFLYLNNGLYECEVHSGVKTTRDLVVGVDLIGYMDSAMDVKTLDILDAHMTNISRCFILKRDEEKIDKLWFLGCRVQDMIHE